MKRATWAAIALLCSTTLLTVGCVRDVTTVTFEVLPLSPPPVFDGAESPGEWPAETLISGAFEVPISGGGFATYPYSVRAGYDEEFLHLRLTVLGAGPNPYSYDDGVRGRTYSDGFGVFITADVDGPIRSPSDWKSFDFSQHFGTTTNDGYWNGHAWRQQDNASDGSLGRGWVQGDDLHWETRIARDPIDSTYDGNVLSIGKTFRMGFLFSRFGAPDGTEPRDADPQPGFTPDGHLNAANWFRFRLAPGAPT